MSCDDNDDDDDFMMSCEACGHEEDAMSFSVGTADGSHTYRCPECHQMQGGEDPSQTDVEDEATDEEPDTQVLLACPQCHAWIGYDEVEVDIHSSTSAQCPQCGGSSPTADWFA